MQPLDFSKRKNFPGVKGNQFDIILKASEKIENIPLPIFLLILLFWAGVITFGNWQITLIMYAFFISDWAFLLLLPILKISFGPAKPPTLILAALRSIGLLFPSPWNIGVQFFGTLLLIYGFYFEPHSIQITHKKIISKKIHPGQTIHILHLSDLHIERITRREKQLIEKIHQLSPDVILFTGDILNLSYLHDPEAWNAAQEIIQQWNAPGGVFLVSGSPAVDLPEIMPEILKGLPLQRLNDEQKSIEIRGQKISLIGLTCTHLPFEDGPTLKSIIEGQNGVDFTILMYHSPDLAPIAAQYPIDLQLSGHTHGGQVRLPFLGSLVTGSLYGRKFQAGPYCIENMLLYISRGIGMEGAGAPRVRFLCPPEIILWEISGPKEI